MSYIGNTATQQAFTPAVDFFNGNGSTTAFTLSRPVASVAQVQAVVENVPQKPNDAFTVSGNTITFTSAPPSGTQNIYVYYTSPITQVIAPGQGTVGPTALTAGAPSWSPSGGVTLPRIDSTNEGGQINFNRASDDTAVWAIDSFGNTSTPSLRFINGATVAMAIDGSNNVGIGTSSPSKKLDVNGSINANSIEVGLNGESIKKASGSLYIETGSANPLIFTTNSAERMRIDSSGNLLVGTTSLYSTVPGVYSTQNYVLGLSTSYWKLAISSNNFFFAYGASGAPSDRANINSSTGVYTALSDKNKKKDFEDSNIGLAEVMKLKPTLFRMLEDDETKEKELGFIAQDVFSVIPQAYFEQDGSDGTKFIGLQDRPIIAALTKAIQEQQAIIEQLTQRITALEAK